MVQSLARRKATVEMARPGDAGRAAAGWMADQGIVRAVLADDPADYTRQWRRMSRRYRLLTSALLTASNSPARTMIVPAATTMPRVFNQAVKLLAQ